MSGIYIHIPFCKTICHYCDFYRNKASHEEQTLYVDALLLELEQRKKFLCSPVTTLYFGGGTPSLLSPKDVYRIINVVSKEFDFQPKEITIECNPDDISLRFIEGIREAGINRISLGVQSFSDKHLKKMNRRHTANAALQAMSIIQQTGLTNISIDLIYGLPNQTTTEWKQDIDTFLSLNIPHLSAYHLTYHEGTVFYRQKQKKQISAPPDELSVAMYQTLERKLIEEGYVHYEISNFAKAGLNAIHNSNYWYGISYLGIGAAAHSYNGERRQWNISDTTKYIERIEKGIVAYNEEVLTEEDIYNDTIITLLRTAKGVSAEAINRFSGKIIDHFEAKRAKYTQTGMLETVVGQTRILPHAWLMSDYIIEDFFYLP